MAEPSFAYVHELTFETRAQAEQAARCLGENVQAHISDVTDDVSYFVDVPSAFDLSIRTSDRLDAATQARLTSCAGHIGELPPRFNQDGSREAMEIVQGPVEVITQSEYRQRKRQGERLSQNIFVLVPVADLQQVDPGYSQQPQIAETPVVYQHRLYFASPIAASTAKDALLERRPRVIAYQSIEVRDLDGDAVVFFQTAEELTLAERLFIRHAVLPVFEKFNMQQEVKTHGKEE